MRKAALLLGMVLLAVAGFAAVAVAADHPPEHPAQTTTPGSPGDDCSHGSNTTHCRTDPSTNGQDCDDHGGAHGNEDHCAATTAEHPPPTTTHETTTVHTTTTTVTHPQTTPTVPPPTTSPVTAATVTTPPATTTQTQTVPSTETVTTETTTTETTPTPTPPPPPPPHPNPPPACVTSCSDLPHTGAPLGLLAGLGGLLTLLGGSGLVFARRR